jgi:hypothetical protein
MKATTLLFFLLFFTATAVRSQTVSGYVYKEAKNKPLKGALVYLDGTTLSTKTDSKGFFTLTASQKFNAVLVVSYSGLETYWLENPFAEDKPVKIALKKNTVRRRDMVVSTKGSAFTRKEMLQAFREQFLGLSEAGMSCKIKNEKDLQLYYDINTNSLKAEAVRPIRIKNKSLQYDVVFDLIDFEANYKAKSLNKADSKGSFFMGTTFFTDISKKGEADEKRNNAYSGSPANFLKVIAQEDWEKGRYELYIDGVKENPASYFSVSDTLNIKKVTLIDILKKVEEMKIQGTEDSGKKAGATASKYKDIKFTILHDKKDESTLSFDKGYFYVDERGMFWPVSEVFFGGYMGSLKIGDMLPVNYNM